DPGQPVVSLPVQAEGGQGTYQRVFEITDVALHVLPVIPEVEDRVADELARSVERRLSAAVGLYHLDFDGLRDVELAIGLGATPDRDHRRVLEEHHRLRNRSLGDAPCERTLEVEGLPVGDESEIQEVCATRHGWKASWSRRARVPPRDRLHGRESPAVRHPTACRRMPRHRRRCIAASSRFPPWIAESEGLPPRTRLPQP